MRTCSDPSSRCSTSPRSGCSNTTSRAPSRRPGRAASEAVHAQAHNRRRLKFCNVYLTGKLTPLRCMGCGSYATFCIGKWARPGRTVSAPGGAARSQRWHIMPPNGARADVDMIQTTLVETIANPGRASALRARSIGEKWSPPLWSKPAGWVCLPQAMPSARTVPFSSAIR